MAVAVKTVGERGGAETDEPAVESRVAAADNIPREPVRVVSPGTLVQVRANPRYFEGRSAFPWLVKELDGDAPPVGDEAMNAGWVEATNVRLAGPVSLVAEDYEGLTWSCGRQIKASKRSALATCDSGCSYTPGPAFVPPQ